MEEKCGIEMLKKTKNIKLIYQRNKVIILPIFSIRKNNKFANKIETCVDYTEQVL